jgi:O-antigen/teichoic acid export membrane protein
MTAGARAPMESIFRPAFMLMSGRALGFVVSFAVPVVLVRVFDQSEFGTYKQLFLIYSTLFGIAQIGMAESLFYFLPSAKRHAGWYILNAMLVLGAAGSVCLLLLWGVESNIASWLNNPGLVGYIPLIGVFLFLMLISAVLEIVMTARKRHFNAFWAYALSDFSRAALLVVPVLLLGGIERLLLGGIAFAALRLGATLFYLIREFDGDLAFDAGLARRQLAYAAPFAIAVLIEVVQANLHLYVVSYRFDAATFAIYAVGCFSIPLVDFLMTSTGNVMMVQMRENIFNGTGATALAVWRDTTRKLALIFIPLVGALLVVAHELIVLLFTSDYERSVPVFMIWTATVLFSTLLTDAVLRVYAQTRFLILLNVIRLALVAGTIGWFLSKFGLLGAVLVTLVATVVAKAIALGRIMAVMKSGFSQLLPWQSLARIIVIGVGAALPALMVKSTLGIPTPLLMFAAGLVYAGSYLALLWRYGPLSDEEKLAFLDWTSRPAAAVRAWRT